MENHCFNQCLEEATDGASGPHLKLETQAVFKQSNSMEVGFKGGPRRQVNRFCSHPRDGVTGTVTLRGDVKNVTKQH